MSSEWFFAAAVVTMGSTLFGRFEEGTPKLREALQVGELPRGGRAAIEDSGSPVDVRVDLRPAWCRRGLPLLVVPCGTGSTPSRRNPKRRYYRLRGDGPASRG